MQAARRSKSDHANERPIIEFVASSVLLLVSSEGGGGVVGSKPAMDNGLFTAGVMVLRRVRFYFEFYSGQN